MHKLIIKAPERQEQQTGWPHNSAPPPPKWEGLPTVIQTKQKQHCRDDGTLGI